MTEDAFTPELDRLRKDAEQRLASGVPSVLWNGWVVSDLVQELSVHHTGGCFKEGVTKCKVKPPHKRLKVKVPSLVGVGTLSHDFELNRRENKREFTVFRQSANAIERSGTSEFRRQSSQTAP